MKKRVIKSLFIIKDLTGKLLKSHLGDRVNNLNQIFLCSKGYLNSWVSYDFNEDHWLDIAYFKPVKYLHLFLRKLLVSNLRNYVRLPYLPQRVSKLSLMLERNLLLHQTVNKRRMKVFYKKYLLLEKNFSHFSLSIQPFRMVDNSLK